MDIKKSCRPRSLPPRRENCALTQATPTSVAHHPACPRVLSNTSHPIPLHALDVDASDAQSPGTQYVNAPSSTSRGRDDMGRGHGGGRESSSPIAVP